MKKDRVLLDYCKLSRIHCKTGNW